MPSPDGFLADADVAPLEADAMLGEQASPNFFHRFDLAAATHAVAFALFHMESETRAADHTGKRIMSEATGLLWVVANGSIFLATLTRDNGGSEDSLPQAARRARLSQGNPSRPQRWVVWSDG